MSTNETIPTRRPNQSWLSGAEKVIDFAQRILVLRKIALRDASLCRAKLLHYVSAPTSRKVGKKTVKHSWFAAKILRDIQNVAQMAFARQRLVSH